MPKIFPRIKKQRKIYETLITTNKELDTFIKNQWKPRMEMLHNNSHSFTSNKELREGYLQLKEIDAQVQKMTLAGQIRESTIREIKSYGKIAGIATVVVAGVALGAAHYSTKGLRKNW